MSEIEGWIIAAATNLDVPLERQAPAVARNVVNEAQAIYVNGNPCSWWLALKLPFQQFSSAETGVTAVLPSSEGPCWFIPETDTEECLVFRLEAKSVEALLGECPYFEYCVLAADFSWLVVESDHNELFVCERNAGES